MRNGGFPIGFICENLGMNESGHLLFAGQDTTELAREYGTPLYLLDEDRIRQNCRTFRTAFADCFGPDARVLYAGKANSFKQIYRIMAEEGLGVDVVSAGEIHTASLAGFDLAGAYFHGSSKTDADIRFAMDRGVGCFVADNAEEVLAVEAEAERRGTREKLLLRLTPGIDPHTFQAVTTGKVDSKFGSAVETGQAEEITALALRQKHVELAGFHCHVGSQIFAGDVFEQAAAVMLDFMAQIRAKYGYTARELDLGGGFAVRYVDSDPIPDPRGRIASIAAVVKTACEKLAFPLPAVRMEPGRAIVADAGLTLYTVGSVKSIPGYKNYVSVDGGMTDSPRFALYGAACTCLPADRMHEPRTLVCDVVGRCCESGDVIQPGVPLPAGIGRGDLIAECTTGAYHYSMASNYNRLPRPPIVMLRGGASCIAVRRETVEDVARLDV